MNPNSTSAREPRANAREITALPDDAVFYLNDHHGSPAATLDSRGALIEEHGYHAYGAERDLAKTGDAAQSFYGMFDDAVTLFLPKCGQRWKS